jgi:hypothetical protein
MVDLDHGLNRPWIFACEDPRGEGDEVHKIWSCTPEDRMAAKKLPGSLCCFDPS